MQHLIHHGSHQTRGGFTRRRRPGAGRARKFRDDLERMFGFIGADQEGKEDKRLECDWRPEADYVETKEAYLIHIDLPGVEKDEIHLEVQNGLLYVYGVRKETHKSKRVSQMECAYGRFGRVFPLPSSVNADAVTAAYEQGVLTVKIPRAEKMQPRRVEII